MKPWILPFSEISNGIIHLVGGNNASLGEMYSFLGSQGVRVPDGFAITTHAFHGFMAQNQLEKSISPLLAQLDTSTYANLPVVGERIRNLFTQANLPEAVVRDIRRAYQNLRKNMGGAAEVAVRSSATAEDLVTASFAGQHESFLNIRTKEELLRACLDCYASLFTNRAIKYRNDQGFDHLKVALSIGVQRMVRSDLASSGVCFTIDPDSGHASVMLVTGSRGLGENVVLGNVNPDEYFVFKPSIGHRRSVISRRVEEKSVTMVYSDLPGHRNTVNIPTPPERRLQLVLTEEEVDQLAAWALTIEKHYDRPMDIEWAKDGQDGRLYIVQVECEAMRRVRQDPRLTNLKLMIPFCRTVEEGKKVLDRMKECGLVRGENDLEVYVMAEIPSNVVRAREFAELFDGFSIGSNDLTQLPLGVDRDSSLVQDLFDENDPAVRDLISMLLLQAHKSGTPVGICGQGPSDNPDFAEFLVREGISSLSFNPDVFLRGLIAVRDAERKFSSHQIGFHN